MSVSQSVCLCSTYYQALDSQSKGFIIKSGALILIEVFYDFSQVLLADSKKSLKKIIAISSCLFPFHHHKHSTLLFYAT